MEVTLTLRATQAADHLMLEDMLPAGLEPQDQGENDQEEWSNWWAQQIVRDDRVAFAVAHLEPGVKRLKYYLRAQTAGRFIALPPRIYDMYDPRRQAEGVADTITVRP